MKTLALAVALSTPAFAAQHLMKLVARSSTPQPSITIKAGEQFSVLSLLVNEELPRSQASITVHYPGIEGTFSLGNGDHVSGPATVALGYVRRTGREVAVAECLWTYNAYAASAPLQSLAIQRSEDASTWSTIRTFEDWSTNAFYRWKIEPRE
jgi:hypothetical protein